MRQFKIWKPKGRAIFGTIIFLCLVLPAAAAIVYAPADPNVEETVTFTVTTGGASNIDWNFGDGTPVVNTSGASVTHAYRQPGTYLVSAYWGPIETVSITIREKRLIDYTPANPRANQPITFTAVSHKLFFRSPKPFVPDLEVAIRPYYNHLIVDIGVLAQSRRHDHPSLAVKLKVESAGECKAGNPPRIELRHGEGNEFFSHPFPLRHGVNVETFVEPPGEHQASTEGLPEFDRDSYSSLMIDP